MDPFDTPDFPFDFVQHIYNFAASSEDLPDLPLSWRPPSGPLSDLFASLDAPSCTSAEPRADSPVSVVNPPSTFRAPAPLALPDVSASDLALALTPDAPAPLHPLPLASASLIQTPVAIAPMRAGPPPADAARAAAEAAVAARAAEAKRIRDYNRKLRNRESAARSNLARKRRREAQRAAEEAKRCKAVAS